MNKRTGGEEKLTSHRVHQSSFERRQLHSLASSPGFRQHHVHRLVAPSSVLQQPRQPSTLSIPAVAPGGHDLRLALYAPHSSIWDMDKFSESVHIKWRIGREIKSNEGRYRSSESFNFCSWNVIVVSRTCNFNFCSCTTSRISESLK